MVNTPFLSIVIPTYNRPKMLIEAIDSVGAFKFLGDVEIIVVEDGQHWQYQIAAQHVKYHSNPTRLGMTPNWNKALSLATGEWLCLLADDDYFKPGAVERAITMLHTIPDPCLVVHSRTSENSIFPPGVDTVRNLRLPAASGNFWHRSIYQDLGGFDERLKFSPDCEYWYRIAAKYPVARVVEKYTKWREHDGNYMRETWRQHDELIKQMALLTKLNMVHRGEDVDDLDVVAASVEENLWDTIIYIMGKSLKVGKVDIYDLYAGNARAMANTNERRTTVKYLEAIRSKTK